MNKRSVWTVIVVVGGLTLASLGGRPAEAGDKAGKLKFEVYKDKKSEFRWRLVGAEGAAVAVSGQGYTTKQSCKDGIESVKKNGSSEKAKFEVYEDKGKQFRWKLLATNGNNIASSSAGFKTKADCEAAVASLKKGLATATVEELKE